MSDSAAEGKEKKTREDSQKHEDDHLQDVPDGAGCTEIWEHLADRRESENEDLEE